MNPQTCRTGVLYVATATWLFVTAAGAQSPATWIVNARAVDGTGDPARAVDVRIENGRITAVARLPADNTRADGKFDAKGLTLAPGFIDAHSHHDKGLFEHRDALAAVSQGITTIIAGQDGGSDFPLADYFARLDAQPAAINVASYAGHGTLRARVMGDDYKRTATIAEVSRMSSLLREELAAGALGLSTGLEYDPGIFSDTSELLELAKIVATASGRYVSHLRSEDRQFWEALNELLTIGRVAKLPVHVSHMKLGMRSLWGQGEKLIATLDQARRDGVEVSADVYPYTMWQSTLTVLYPKRNFEDRKETEFILEQVAAPEDLVISEYTLTPAYVGKNLRQISSLRGSDPATTLMALIADARAKQAGESVIGTSIDESDVSVLLKWPYTGICTDGALQGAHPRGFGAFPRVLGRYVREQRALTLEEAIRKMTTLTASNAGITDRGIIRPGMWADLVLFDPKTVADQASIQSPHALSRGIQTVWVNGEIVFQGGKPTGKYPGRALRRNLLSTTPTAEQRVDEFVRAEMERQHVPGIAIGIVNKGEVTAKGYGYANLEHKVPVTSETIFQSGSVGKMFTATAVMLLVENGKLSLTDPITKFFPDAPETWREITVRHLLTHTSGIPDYTTSTFDYRKDYTEDQLVHLAYQQPLEFQPGARWNYSNTGYALLGFIVGKASGQFYGELLAQRVFKPVGMKTTRIISEEDIVPNRAAGYQLVNGEVKNQGWVAPILNSTADGSVYWSVNDLLAWTEAVKQRKVLKVESWDQILSPVRLNSGKTYPYGMGWFLDQRNGRPVQQHGGSWQGFKAQLTRFISDDLDVIVLANLAQADPAAFVDGIAVILNPSLAVKKPEPIEDREPQVTQTVLRLLGNFRQDKVTKADFAYVRAGFFPDVAKYWREELTKLGEPTRTQLLERREQGDDRIYLYKLTFGSGVRYLRIGLVPDDRISSFSMQSQL